MKRKLARFWIPVGIAVAVYAGIGVGYLPAKNKPLGHHSPAPARKPARPPALFDNGEVAQDAATGRQVIILAHRWDGNGWVYAVTPK